MTGPDLLESGSARPRSRRRLTGWAAVAAIIVGAVVLAARAGGDPPQHRAAPAPVVTPLVGPVRNAPYFVYDATVAGDRVHALAGVCVTTRSCGYRLLTWDGARWSSTLLAVPKTAEVPGRLLVTGRYLAVLDGTKPGAYVSTDGGRTFHTRPARTGPPVATVPAGLIPELGERGVGVFDPATGRWHPLATQPMSGLRSVAAAGRTIRAVARQGTALVVATSTDAGRTWTRTTVTRVPYRTPELQLVPSVGDSAYLVVTRPLAAGEPGVAEIWRSGPTWTRSADFLNQGGSTPRFSNAVSTPTGGLLLADGTSGGVLTYDTGTEVSLALPPGASGDPPLIPLILRTDPTGTVAAITADGWHLLLRHSTDATWRVLPLPA
ncbi:MAG TPA: hypothetical protein VLM05_09700 [Mycobacteriales bacterium]|nr:hypothetical protein [Mycobacteriales bacterium]